MKRKHKSKIRRWLKKSWIVSIFKNHPISTSVILCAFFGTLFICAYYFNFHTFGLSDDTSHWGTFGDYVGGVVGTLFNFTGVILIYLTFRQQQRNSVLQQFESTFFNMLTTHRELVQSVSGGYTGSDGNISKGVDFLLKFQKSLFKIMEEVQLKDTKEKTQEKIHEKYLELYTPHAYGFGHYFRHLYHLIKYTDESEIKDKKKYVDIVQAQMNQIELYCCFYNAISGFGIEKALPLLDKYGFFENMASYSELFDQHKLMFYPKTDFKFGRY